MDRWTKELSNVIQNLAHQKGAQIQKEKSDIKATESIFFFQLLNLRVSLIQSNRPRVTKNAAAGHKQISVLAWIK